MNKKELIEKIQKLPDNSKIIVLDDCNEEYKAEEVQYNNKTNEILIY